MQMTSEDGVRMNDKADGKTSRRLLPMNRGNDMQTNPATIGDVKPTYGVRMKNKVHLKSSYMKTSNSQANIELPHQSAIEVKNQAIDQSSIEDVPIQTTISTE